MHIRSFMIISAMIFSSITLSTTASASSEQAIHAHQCKKLVESLEILQKEYQELQAGQMELHAQYVCQGMELEEEQKKNQFLTEEVASLKEKVMMLKEGIRRLMQQHNSATTI